MVMELLSLPMEILEVVLRSLSPKDLISVSRTCKKLNEIVQRDELWAAACLNKFGITIPPSSEINVQRLYKNLLHRYGNLLGFWRKPSVGLSSTNQQDCQPLKDYYGGLLQVLYSEGEIIGYDLLPPKEPHLMEPLRPKKLFSISMNETKKGKAVIKCYCSVSPIKHDTCKLSTNRLGQNQTAFLGSIPRGTVFFTMKCRSSTQDVSQRRQLMKDEFSNQWLQWRADQVDITDQEALQRINLHLRKKFAVLVDCAVNMVATVYSRLEFPRFCAFLVPIQPGFFKGSFSDCGIQIVKLAYADEHTVGARKITGDANNFAGYTAFTVDLRFCMHLNEEAQETMDLIEQLNISSSDLNWSELLMPQPFILPEGCNDRYLAVPNQCKARFQGAGCIGSTLEQDFPTNTSEMIEGKKGHWIVFDDDLFGFLWISSKKFSLFHRVQDPSLQALKKN